MKTHEIRPLIEIEHLIQEPDPAVPTIPWVSENSTSWRTTQPLFFEKSTTSALVMRGWVAMTDSELLLRVEVEDPLHINDKTDGEIWNGDFLRVSIDAWGDGCCGGAPETRGVMGPDDLSVGFALTPTGAQGWIYNAFTFDETRAYPTHLLKFLRDDKAAQTVYEIKFPWSRLDTTPGLFPTIAMVVQLRDVQVKEQRIPEHLRWGKGADLFQPGLFQVLRVGEPPHHIAAAKVMHQSLWTLTHWTETQVAVKSPTGGTVKAQAGAVFTSIDIPKDDLIHRFRVKYRPSLRSEQPLEIHLPSPSVSVVTLQPFQPELLIEEFKQRCEELILRAENPLMLRHWHSIRSLVLTEWTRVSFLARENPAPAREAVNFVRKILSALHGSAQSWDTYVKDGRPLIFLHVSRTDGTLQPYSLTLPKNWTHKMAKEATLPLFVELHGAGNPNPLSHVSTHLADGAKPDLAGYQSARSHAMLARDGYLIIPHGRGNLFYMGVAENDVWEAMADFKRSFKTDPDRQYLYGFSMGGGGAWRLGTRTPDRWAAIAIYSPAVYRFNHPSDLIASNLENTPVWLWTGDADMLIDDHHHIENLMKKAGVDLTVSEGPGKGHVFLQQKESYEWLLQHRRKRPDRFSYVADTIVHLGIWGIKMERDLTTDVFPSFTCEIEDQVVTLTSRGALGMMVELGEGGLGLQGPVTVIWNGKKTYQGPANAITIGFVRPHPCG